MSWYIANSASSLKGNYRMLRIKTNMTLIEAEIKPDLHLIEHLMLKCNNNVDDTCIQIK